MSFKSVRSELFFSRQDPQDPRLGDLARALPPQKLADDLQATLQEVVSTADQGVRNFVLAGYPDDEGIQINGARIGSSQAPDAIRKPLYKMTPPLLQNPQSPRDFQIWDLGNLDVPSLSLADRHERISSFVKTALGEGLSGWIGLGGGHDYGMADASGYLEWMRQNKPQVRPLVINFDAHLDVRPATRGLSSGTPFYRMLEKYPDVDFAEIGIQAQCNSRSHLNWVKSKGARVLTQEEVEASGESFSTNVVRLLGDWLMRPRPVFLSIDIDGFSSAFAPGCSQSWATGFTPQDFFPCLEILRARLEIKVLGIYEVSPPLDHDDRTAKLAAQIIHRVMS